MLDAARETGAKQVLVATEVGMLHQLRKAAPGVDFQAVNDRASCPYMKMITRPRCCAASSRVRTRSTSPPMWPSGRESPCSA